MATKAQRRTNHENPARLSFDCAASNGMVEVRIARRGKPLTIQLSPSEARWLASRLLNVTIRIHIDAARMRRDLRQREQRAVNAGRQRVAIARRFRRG